MESLVVFFILVSPYTVLFSMILMTIITFNERLILYRNPWNTGLLFLFIWSLFVGIINKNYLSSVASVALLLYFFTSIYLQNNYYYDKTIERLLKKIVVFSVGCAFIGILEKLTSIFYKSVWWGYVFGIPEYHYVALDYRISATFGNPNIAGLCFASLILLCFYFYDNESGFKKFLYGLASCLFILVLYFTGSRGATIGLLPGLITYGILRKQKKNRVFLAFILFSVIILMFIVPATLKEEYIPAETFNASMNHELNTSVYSRKEIWSGTLKMFKEKPMTGWGIMGIYCAKLGTVYRSKEPHAHNIWLTFAATLGLIGLGAYIYMKIYLYGRLKMLLVHNCRLAPLLVGIQVIILGHGIIDFPIMAPQGGIIFFGCSALITSLSIKYSDSYNSFSLSLGFIRRRLKNLL